MNKTSNTSVQSSELGIGQYLPTGLYFDVAKQPQVTTHFVAQNWNRLMDRLENYLFFHTRLLGWARLQQKARIGHG